MLIGAAGQVDQRLSRMAEVTDENPYLFVSYHRAYLYVFWKQATPSSSEIAALHRIDPRLQGKTSSEVAALLKDEDWWRLGPLAREEEVNMLEEQLRSAGFAVEKKWQ
jgi:hypothetical protein